MNLPAPRLLALAAAALALLALGAGFVVGALSGSRPLAADASAETQAELPPPRDPRAAIAALGARKHWGTYRAPQGEQAGASAEARRTAPDANAIERDFLLVGIEGTTPRLRALLLPRAGAGAAMTSGGGDDIIRLRAGDTLIEGVTVTEIGPGSVSFRAGDDTLTLNLYGDSP